LTVVLSGLPWGFAQALKQEEDPNETAFRVVSQATIGEAEPQMPPSEVVSAVMAAMGRKGGLKGGHSRAKRLTAERRKAIAKKAALARWAGRG
jgi:hypothetical protein